MKKIIVVSAIAAGLSAPSVFAQSQEPKSQPSNKQTPVQTENKNSKDTKSKQTQTEPAQKNQQKSTESKKSTEQPKSTQTQQPSPSQAQQKQPTATQQKQTDTKAPNQPKQTQNQPSDQSKSKVQLSDDQKTKFEQEVRKQNIKSVSNVNVTVRIGSKMPSSVRLHAMPAALVTLVPEYRNYRVVVVSDEICVVDPKTYVIVEVIGGNSHRSTQQTAALELSPQERMMIIREAKWDDARADIQVRLGLGAEIPSNVKVVEFDDRIVKDVPKLKGYKYVTVGSDLVIVDDHRNVALMISR